MTLLLFGVGLYAVLLTRETRALAHANSVRIDADHKTLMAIQRALREQESDAQR